LLGVNAPTLDPSEFAFLYEPPPTTTDHVLAADVSPSIIVSLTNDGQLSQYSGSGGYSSDGSSGPQYSFSVGTSPSPNGNRSSQGRTSPQQHSLHPSAASNGSSNGMLAPESRVKRSNSWANTGTVQPSAATAIVTEGSPTSNTYSPLDGSYSDTTEYMDGESWQGEYHQQ